MKITKINNFVLYFIFCVSCVLANLMDNSIFAFVAFAIGVFKIFYSQKNEKLCFIFFLIPNIRILDVSKFQYLVNFLFIIGGITFVFDCFIHHKFEKKFLLLLSVIIILCLPTICKSYSVTQDYFDILNLIFDIIFFYCLVHDDDSIDKEKVINNLFFGICFSTILFNLSNDAIHQVFVDKYRFSAYGHDPNYFSCYLLFVMSYFAEKIINDKHNLKYLFKVLICFGIGLLTSSKMFFLLGLLLGIVIVINLFSKKRITKIPKLCIALLLIILALNLFFHDQIILVFNKVYLRFFNTTYTGTMSNITTGRSDIMLFYIQHSLSNIFSFLFGRGINYLNYYSSFGIKLIAHNTYMDFYLSFGFLGTILFFITLLYTNDLNKKIKNVNKKQLLIFLLFLLSLSFMKTDMFWIMFGFLFMKDKNGQIANNY